MKLEGEKTKTVPKTIVFFFFFFGLIKCKTVGT